MLKWVAIKILQRLQRRVYFTDRTYHDIHIVTAGALDTHVHFICPQLVEEALASGVTTLYGGGTGPNHGTLATTTFEQVGPGASPDPRSLR